MINNFLSSHAGIIGTPISIVNRLADTFSRHPVSMRLGERLRTARELRGKTQKQVAKAAGIEQSSVSELETGESKTMAAETLISISLYLNVRPEWLLKEKGDMEYASGLDLSAKEVKLILTLRNASPEFEYQSTVERRVVSDRRTPKPGKWRKKERREIVRRQNGQQRH